MDDFRKVLQVDPIPTKSGKWPEYNITFDDGEVMTLGVPTELAAKYTPEPGDEIRPYKNKIGKFNVTDKGYRKGRGKVQNSKPSIEASTPSTIARPADAQDPWFEPQNAFIRQFNSLLEMYKATLSTRSEPKEVALLIDECFDKTVEITEKVRAYFDKTDNTSEKPEPAMDKPKNSGLDDIHQDDDSEMPDEDEIPF